MDRLTRLAAIFDRLPLTALHIIRDYAASKNDHAALEILDERIANRT